jgi:uncharacterized membrane protein
MPPMFRRFATLIVVALLAAFLPLAGPARAATYTVTTTADSGANSLRQAIINANTAAGADTIAFNIPTADAGYNATGQYWTIRPATPLPSLTGGATTIDGSTQPGGRVTGPKIVLDGGQITNDPAQGKPNGNGITITSSNNIIKGLSIVSFFRGDSVILGDGGVGILVIGTSSAVATSNKIVGSWIGTADGLNAAPNTDYGIIIDDRTQNTTIGGLLAGEGNVIAGNGNSGTGDANLQIGQVHSNITNPVPISGNTVIGNYIGTKADGTAVIGGGNLGDGVVMSDWAQDNTIGGATAAARNVIAGHTAGGAIPASGVVVAAQASRPGSGNVIAGNYIGTDKNGTAKIANVVGVSLNGATNTTVGGPTAASRNIISGNSTTGVLVQNNIVSDNTIANNYVGLAANGAALGNTDEGVWVQLGATRTTIGPGNVISANGREGVRLTTGGNTIKGNFISTNQDGSASSSAVANGQVSVRLDGGTGNVVGGTAASDRNVIGLGNGLVGVEIRGPSSSGHSVYGNNIGVNASGSAKLVTTIPAGSSNILILAGATNNRIGEANGVGAGNVIGGADVGIKLQDTGTTGNMIKNNSIGIGTGGQNVGNVNHGIHVTGGPTGNTIGGVLGTEGNLVAQNGFYGIYFDGPTTGNNTVAGNTVRNNAGSGIRVRSATGVKITQTQTSGNGGTGIELATGGNASLAAPTNLQFTTPGGVPTLTGNACANCVIEVFTSPTRDDGEGPRYLTTTTADGSGAFSIAVTGCDPLLTATARNASNNTSPFTTPMIPPTLPGCQSPQPDVALGPGVPASSAGSPRPVAAGASIVYTHRVTNTGTLAGNFTITRSSTQGWAAQPAPATITNLGPGQSRTVLITVTVPLGTPFNTSDQTTVTASVGAKSQSQSDYTVVPQIFGVVIDPPTRNGSVNPGPTPVTIDYTHYITNTGNGPDTINLTAVPSAAGVTATILNGTSCALAAGAGCTKTVRVTVPANSTATQDTTTVTARSAGDATKQDQAVDTTQIRQSPIPQITPTAQTKNALPPATVTFTHTVKNIGGATGFFTPTLQNSPPAGWTFSPPTPSSFSLAPGASQVVTLIVGVPANADAGTDVTANLKVDSSSGASATAADTIHVLLNPSFSFNAASVSPASGLPGQTVAFTHTLTNQANGPDSFTIVLTSTPGLTNLSYTPFPLNLTKGQSVQVIVRATIVAGTLAGPQQIGATAQRTSSPTLPVSRLDKVTVLGAAVPQLTTTAPQTPTLPLPRTITFTHTLRNIGNQTGTFSLGASAPSGWSATTSVPTCTSLAPNATCTFTVQVIVPAGALAGQYRVIVTASSPDGSTSVTDLVNVPPVPALLFTPDRNGNADPGTVVTYTHALTNTGNITDSFAITLTSDAGWSAVANPMIVANVPPGATRSVQVIVSAPGGLSAGSSGVVTATATSAFAPFPSKRVVDRTTINAKPGATLVPAQQSLSANPTDTLSDTVTFQHTLRNTGSVAITYTLTTSNNPNRWTTIVTPTQVGPLAPGAQTTIQVQVTVPAGTLFGEVTTTTLRVQQLGGPTTDLATALDITRVGPQFGALLTPAINYGSALPGATVVYTHTLRNSGADEDTFLLSTIAPNNWDTRVAPSSVSLPRNGSTIITVTVQVPTSALSTTLDYPADIATVRAASVSDVNGVGTAQEHTTVLQVAGVSLSPSRFRTAIAGSVLSFQHTLRNTGNGMDTFDLTWTISGTGVLTWNVTLSPPSDTLLPSDINPVVFVTVRVPANAAPDAVGRIVVTATSRRDPRVAARLDDVFVGPARLTTQQLIYLPIVMR